MLLGTLMVWYMIHLLNKYLLKTVCQTAIYSTIKKLAVMWLILCVFIAQSCPAVGDPMDYSSAGSSVHGILKNTGVELPFPSPGDLSNPEIEPRSALQADSLLSEPPEKPA